MIWLVYRKELLETLRDRRTLAVMVLLPLALYPLLGIGVSEWVSIQHSARGEQISAVALEGPRWAELDERLTQHKRLKLSRLAAGTSRAKAIANGRVDLVLTVPASFERALAGDGTVKLTLTHDEASDRSQLARGRVRKLLDDYGEQVVRERLARHRLPATVTAPLAVADEGIASTEQIGSHLLSGVLPVLVVLMVLLGAFYPAIDLTAGEKERGTLETLLCSPVPRMSLIVGKFLVVATVAAVTGLLNLGSLGLAFALGFSPALEAAGVASDLPWAAIAMTAIAVVPAALFFAAVMIAIAALAHSFKEAQTLLTPVYLVCVVPAMLVQLPGIELNLWTAALPAVNIALLAGELIGGHLPLAPTLIALATSFLYAGVALAFAARIYNSERLLFSQRAGRFRWWGRGRAHPPRQSSPDPAHAAALLGAVIVLLVFVGRPLQARGIISGILATEWLLIALPVVVLLRWTNVDARLALSLRPPPLRPLLGAVIAGLSGWYVVGVLVEGLQQRVMPMPPEMAEQARRLLFSGDRSLALDLFALAVSPAICEELLFRGALLSAAVGPPSHRSSPPRPGQIGVGAAVLINAVLFGIFHLSIYRLMPTMLLGLVLALLVVRTGSIWIAMTFHLLNNAATVVAGRHFVGLAEPEVSPPGWYALVALGCFAGGLALALHRPAAGDSPPGPTEVTREERGG